MDETGSTEEETGDRRHTVEETGSTQRRRQEAEWRRKEAHGHVDS